MQELCRQNGAFVAGLQKLSLSNNSLAGSAPLSFLLSECFLRVRVRDT